jgi:hypothetical protein
LDAAVVAIVEGVVAGFFLGDFGFLGSRLLRFCPLAIIVSYLASAFREGRTGLFRARTGTVHIRVDRYPASSLPGTGTPRILDDPLNRILHSPKAPPQLNSIAPPYWPARGAPDPRETEPLAADAEGSYLIAEADKLGLRQMANLPITFRDVLVAWYGLGWRRTAPPALGRSRRTIEKWAADDSKVPRWAWQRFTADRQSAKWRSIDRTASEQHVRIKEQADQQKSAVHLASRFVEDRLRRTEFEPQPRPGRPRKRPDGRGPLSASSG